MSRINTNVPSIVAARILDRNNATMNKALERLSTGLRINSGKDDPAGLIASEMLRSEIKAIDTAIDNAKRADQVVSVAEGGLREINALLIELETLVDRTANEAAISDDEVTANQLQIDAILDTINRISSSTEFMGKKLLNGTLDYTTSGLSTGVNASAITDLKVTGARIAEGSTRTVLVDVTQSAQTGELRRTGATVSAISIQISGKYGTEQLSFASGTAIAAVAAGINGSSSLTGVSAAVSGTVLRMNSTEYGDDSFVTVNTISGNFSCVDRNAAAATNDAGRDVGVTINGTAGNGDGLDVTLHTNSMSLEMTLAEAFATQTANDKSFVITGGGADFSIAPTLGINAMASLGISNVATGSLGRGDVGYLSSLGSGQTNQLTAKNFETAQRIVRAANTQISRLRGRLGAFQKNTLGSMVNSLQVALENTTAAESAIRDADFARETSNLTRAQILVQSSTAALQMANAAPQNVLALLG